MSNCTGNTSIVIEVRACIFQNGNIDKKSKHEKNRDRIGQGMHYMVLSNPKSGLHDNVQLYTVQHQ